MKAEDDPTEQRFHDVQQLNRALREKVRQLTALQETGRAIVSVPDLGRLLSLIMDILFDVCRMDRAVILLLNRGAGCLEYLHGAGFGGRIPDWVKAYRVPLCRADNPFSRVVGTGQSESLNESTRVRQRKDVAQGHPTGMPCDVVVPLITLSRVIGVLAADASDGPATAHETLGSLEIFAPQIAIAIQNATLCGRLREEMQAVQKSRALLARAEKLSFLGDLAAQLAHEIKNPMTTIGTFLQLLPTQYHDPAFLGDFLAIAMEEARRINRLLDELLDLARPREPQREPTDLNDLIRKMIVLAAAHGKARSIAIQHRLDPRVGRVWVDAEKIRQVLINVLSNAVDFSPAGGNIRVSTELRGPGSPAAPSLCIRITDSGPGIDPVLADRIFEPYFTTKNNSLMHNGTGLGLFVALQAMHDHGGDIEVDSRAGEGATFVLTLPIPSDTPTSPQQPFPDR